MTTPTKHQIRCQQVRDRLNALIPKLPLAKRRGGLTPYGTFAERMAKVAKDGGEWPWKSKTLTTGGAPKDLPYAIKRFAESKSGMFESTLDLIELTCIEFERELRAKPVIGAETADELVTGLGGVVGVENAMLGAPPVPGVYSPAQVATLEAMAVDPEIEALYDITRVLEPLDLDAKCRVLSYVAKRVGVQILAA